MAEPNYLGLNDRQPLLPSFEFNPTIVNPQADALPERQRLQQHRIVRALTQVLTPAGVRFKFSIQRHPQARELTRDSEKTVIQSPDSLFKPLEYRVWVLCHSQKSLDCQLLAQPLAKSLRSLDLQEFQDAIIQFSRSDATSADWRLRLDLTPPAVMLKNWARWGDVQAIVKLLNFALAPREIQVSATLKSLTLHLFCTLTNSQPSKFPAKKIALDTIAPLLVELTPQGIQSVTIYGVQSQLDLTESPVWVHWLDLPAATDPKFTPTPLMLAEKGDESALNFVLERVLNPDLEECFAVGGLRLFLLRRDRVLHIMSEAPQCPIQSQVVTAIMKMLRQLALPGLRGVRLYGRISGQLAPLWTYGVDFEVGPLELPPAAPEQQFVKVPSVARIGIAARISGCLAATQIWKPQFIGVKTNQLVHLARFEWKPSLLLLLVGLGLAIASDLAIESILATKHLADTSTESTTQVSFNNPLLEQKLAQYQVRCVQNGVPDVLIVGSSRALRGVDSGELRRNLIDRGYVDPKIYNFGINGATAQVIDVVLRQLLTPQQLPKLVIWADGSRSFNSGRADRTYETIVLSERYRQLALMLGIGNNSSFFQVQSSFKNTYQAIDNGVDRQLSDVSLAYHHRDRLKSWLQAQVPYVREILDSSSAVANADPASINEERDVDIDGFLPVKLQFDPTIYYQQHPKVTGYSDGDYANFQLRGTQHQALRQTTDFLANRKIPMVFVNVPLTDVYLDKMRRQYEMIFKNYMQELMRLERLTFVDLDGVLNKQYDRFSDPSHLNQFGAIEVSHYLAETPLIPWTKILRVGSVGGKGKG